MKLGKALYISGIIIMIFLSIVMLKNSMYILGGLFSIVSFVSILNYIDIEQINRAYDKKPAKRRRAAYFSSLTEAEKERYLSDIEKQIK